MIISTKKRSLKLITMLLMLCTFSLKAQSPYVAFQPGRNYSFVHEDQNYISNAASLNPVFEKLYGLKMKKVNAAETISMVHIGDSHIQADYLTGAIRFNIQHEFGNAGRGLIVPLRVAHTNESYSYRTFSNVHCDAKRCVFTDNPIPIGVGGVTIRTDSANAFITIKTFNYPGFDYSFNRITVFHDKTQGNYDIGLMDSIGNSVGYISAAKVGAFRYASTIDLPYKTNFVTLQNLQSTPFQFETMIYGFEVENGNSGVFYHAIGVNGAEYRHYAKAAFFAEQTQALFPDVFVISMGTNEAQEHDLSQNTFYNEIDSMVSQLLMYNPNAKIILTSPPDSYYHRKYKNAYLSNLVNTMERYANNHQLAFWNLYEITGGYGSCTRWKSNHLMAYDGVHFTRGGYELQGNLFFEALMNAYNTYVAHRPK